MGKALKAAVKSSTASKPSKAKTKFEPAGLSDIVEAVQLNSELSSKRAATEVVKVVFDAMIDKMIKHEGIRINGLGVFHIKARAARQGRNVRTGASIAIPARKVVGFRPAVSLKAAVDGAGKKK